MARSAIPAAIGRYRILSRIGKGAMGIVYSAHDEQIERDVAIKVMMADLEGEPDTRARFFREAQITSQLLHRNIVTVYDLGEDDGRPFIVMELLAGCTLNEFLKDRKDCTLERRVELMIQTCEGLSVAHAKGIVHRDVKPGNLFVNGDGSLKILDFGVARLASSSMTASGLIVGTPDYMSPEQARGKEVDPRSDIFSAAAVFYLMLTGRKPFEGPDLPVVLQRVVREDPLPIREQEAPPALAVIIMRALSKEPERRYQSCGEMASELTRFKRQFDAETRQIGSRVRQRYEELVVSAATVRELRSQLAMAPSEAVEEIEAGVRERHPFLRRPPDDPMTVAPGRAALNAATEDLDRALAPLSGQIDRLRATGAAVTEAERLLAADDARGALAQFDRARQGLGAEESRRILDGAARARALFAEQQARADRIRALLAEARDAEKRSDWTAVAARAGDVIALDPQNADALPLASRARAALAREAEARARRVQQLLAQAATLVGDRRFDRAEALIGEARTIGADSGTVRAAQQRLEQARIAAAEADAAAKLAAETIAAARAAFDGGDRGGAIERLDAFVRDHAVAPGVAVEAERLRAEARRLAAMAEQRANAEAKARQAETAWQNGDARAALAAAEQALVIERSQPLALKIQGQARARLREQAERAERAAAASVHVGRSVELTAAGRFDRAAREAQRALEIDPGNLDASNALVELRRREAAAEAARQSEEATREREREVEKLLKDVRASLRAKDFPRAAWTAENALVVYPGYPLAQELLAQARAALAAESAAQPDADGTVQMVPDGVVFDPDDTAVVRERSGGIKDFVTSVGDWASAFRRRRT